jgi:hypothetical protein
LDLDEEEDGEVAAKAAEVANKSKIKKAFEKNKSFTINQEAIMIPKRKPIRDVILM